MGFDQYHEPANELSPETRTFARMIASLTEEAEAPYRISCSKRVTLSNMGRRLRRMSNRKAESRARLPRGERTMR